MITRFKKERNGQRRWSINGVDVVRDEFWSTSSWQSLEVGLPEWRWREQTQMEYGKTDVEKKCYVMKEY